MKRTEYAYRYPDSVESAGIVEDYSPRDTRPLRARRAIPGRGAGDDERGNATADEERVMQGILEEIKEERERQDEKWGGPDHDNRLSPGDWIRLIVRQLGDADRAMEDGRLAYFRRQMVQVAALAVAAIETHDRLASDADVEDDQ